MNIKCYKGISKAGDEIYSNDIIRYTVSEGRLSVLLKGLYPKLNMKYNDIITVEITNMDMENISCLCRYVSMNYVVYDDPSTSDAPIVADNSILFEIIE